MLKQKISLKARALRYLSMREHSRFELARKLSRYAEEGDKVDELLDTLEAAKFLSNQRFSDSLVNRRATRFGNQRIVMELKSNQVDNADITRIKQDLAGTEVPRAIDVLHRKFAAVPQDQAAYAKQQRFLMQRGFSSRAIQAAMKADRE